MTEDSVARAAANKMKSGSIGSRILCWTLGIPARFSYDDTTASVTAIRHRAAKTILAYATMYKQQERITNADVGTLGRCDYTSGGVQFRVLRGVLPTYLYPAAKPPTTRHHVRFSTHIPEVDNRGVQAKASRGASRLRCCVGQRGARRLMRRRSLGRPLITLASSLGPSRRQAELPRWNFHVPNHKTSPIREFISIREAVQAAIGWMCRADGCCVVVVVSSRPLSHFHQVGASTASPALGRRPERSLHVIVAERTAGSVLARLVRVGFVAGVDEEVGRNRLPLVWLGT